MSKKILGVGVVLALVAVMLVGVGASTASAQSMSLCQTVDALIAAGVIAPDKVASAKAAAGCGTVMTAGYTFTKDLTIGSTGADVTALQNALISNGFTIAAGATGYFGSQTQAAVIAYQKAKGITPAVGYVGPLTRASLNANAATTPSTPVSTVPGCVAGALFSSTTGASCTSVSTVPGCAVGALFSATTGASCTGSTSSTAGITTTGEEGIITVSASNAGLTSTVYEGDSRVKVLGVKVEAKNSDLLVQRIKVDLGASTSIYNKVLDTIYVMDGSTIAGSVDLDSSTVTKEGSSYVVTITGLNILVKQDASKTITIAVDLKGSIDSTYRTSKTISIPVDGVRAIDGAGINQYGATAVSKSFTVSADLVESASLKTSISSASPVSGTIIASSGSLQDEADQVETLVFRIKAERDDVLINELTVSATGTAVAAGMIPTAYLFDGSTELDNAAVSTSTGLATFTNLDLTIDKDSTKSLTIKLDVRNATTSAYLVTTSVDGTLIDAENTIGDTITNTTGSATGEEMRVQTAGAVYTLVGTPSLTKSDIGTTASSTFLASFTFDVGAKGSSVEVASTSAFVVGIYVNNAQVATTTAVYARPTTGTTLVGGGDFNIADGSTARFLAQVSFIGPNGVYIPAGGIVNARIESATTDAGTVTYISDTFRTGSQTL